MTIARSRILLGVAVAAVLLVGVVAVVARSGDDDGSDVATDSTSTSSTSSTSSSTSTTEVAATTSPSVAETTTTKGTTTSTTPKEPAPEARCADGSTGAATPPGIGWEKKWTTKPADNDPATIRVCVDDVTPKVGQVVHLTLVGDDPDAKIVQNECGWHITWEGDHSTMCRDFLTPVTAPSPPPPEEHGHVEITDEHAYGTAGDRILTASVWSAEYTGVTSPYSSRAEVSITMRVHA